MSRINTEDVHHSLDICSLAVNKLITVTLNSLIGIIFFSKTCGRKYRITQYWGKKLSNSSTKKIKIMLSCLSKIYYDTLILSGMDFPNLK